MDPGENLRTEEEEEGKKPDKLRSEADRNALSSASSWVHLWSRHPVQIKEYTVSYGVKSLRWEINNTEQTEIRVALRDHKIKGKKRWGHKGTNTFSD